MNIRTWVLGICVGSLASAAGFADSGRANLTSTAPGGTAQGTVNLVDTPQGLTIDASLTGAPAGMHAFHIHEFGSCDNEAKAAGSHYNPAGHPHGNALKDGIMKTHAGDFGSITIDKAGNGTLHAVIPGLALVRGEATVAGRAFVLHEKADDFSQPAGNAGGRIACGAIVVTGK